MSQHEPKVTFIAPIWEYHPVICSSLIAQIHKNWELLLIHDGPCQTGIGEFVLAFKDRRIQFIETPYRKQTWGHPIREWALKEIGKGILSPGCDFICITNADNYYMPSFCDHNLQHFTVNTVATYCETIVHNYFDWGCLTTELKLGHIDICAFMIRKKAACDLGWSDMQHSSDWTLIDNMIKRYGIKNIKKIPSCLVVHN